MHRMSFWNPYSRLNAPDYYIIIVLFTSKKRNGLFRRNGLKEESTVLNDSNVQLHRVILF